MRKFAHFVKMVVAGTLLAACTIGGCTAATPQKRAFQVIESVRITVDTAMKASAKMKVEGAITDAQWDAVTVAYAKYQKAAIFAGTALMAANETDTLKLIGDVSAAAAALTELVATLKAPRAP